MHFRNLNSRKIPHTSVHEFPTSEIKVEFLSAAMDGRVMKDATVPGSECTRKAMEVSTRNGAERKFPLDEEVRRHQGEPRNGGKSSR